MNLPNANDFKELVDMVLALATLACIPILIFLFCALVKSNNEKVKYGNRRQNL